jgi:hypothetical protein
MSRRGRRGAAVAFALVGALVAGLALGGCSRTRHSTPAGGVSARPSTSPSVDASTAAATAEILEILKGYNDVMDTAARTADVRVVIEQLPRYAADPELARDVNGINLQNSKGYLYEGNIVYTPRVTEIHLTGSPATATIEVCIDSTNWRSLVKTDRSPRPRASGLDRSLGYATATLIQNKGWRITDARSTGKQPC